MCVCVCMCLCVVFLVKSLQQVTAFVLQEQATIQFCAHKLDKKDFFGKSDPFLTFSRSNEDGRYMLDKPDSLVARLMG